MPAPDLTRAPGLRLAGDLEVFPDLKDADQSTTQWLFTEDDLKLTPSVLGGLSMKQERQSRAKGVNFILQVGILLKLPQITLASASAFLHRFFMRYSMPTPKKLPNGKEFHYYSVAAASVWLAAKVEENCRKMKEVVIACVRVAQKDSNKIVDEQDKEYWRWRDTIIALEDKLLEGLCFDLSLESPYKALYDIICRFDAHDNKVLRNAAWAFVNDSCFAPLCVLFPSRTIAAASVYAAARSCKVEFLDEDGKPWWEIIGVPLTDIRRACNYMADVYEDAPLREGARQDLYQRTPVNGDEKDAKTRAPAGATSDTMEVSSVNRTSADNSQRGTREGSVASASSTTSKKRSRYENLENERRSALHNNGSTTNHGQQPVSMNDVPWGGESPAEREAKRVKQEAAVNGLGQLQSTSIEGPMDKVRVDDVKSTLDANGNKTGHGDRGRTGKMDADAKSDEPSGLVSPDVGGSEEGELDE